MPKTHAALTFDKRSEYLKISTFALIMMEAFLFSLKSKLTIAGVILIASVSLAQNGSLEGRIIDEETNEPLEFAAISVLSLDSALVTGTITDIDGQFEVQVKPGTYRLKTEFISYEITWVDQVVVTEGTTSVGDITMSVSAAMLEEVEVTGEKSQFQLSLDKKIFNVDKDIVTRGGNAADVLDNIPSVSVDIEGNVSLRGSQNVRILVDGRPSGLVGLSSNDALRMLRGDMIEKVEIVTNPSARYDAEGMAGIINIVLKKEQQRGFNGSFSGSVGYPANLGGSANLNYRKKNFNFFVNYGLNYDDRPGGGKLYQEYYEADSTYYLEQTQDRTRGGISHNVRLGTDFYFNDNNILTGAFLYRISDERNESSLVYRDFDEFRNLTAVTIRDEIEDEDEPNIEYSLNYKRNFARKDHVLTASIQYDDNSEVETADYTERVLNPDLTPTEIPDILQRSRNSEGNISWSGQVDYVLPIRKDNKFETGYKASIRDIKTEYFVEELRDGEWESLIGLVNDFNYDENIHAAYLIYGNKTGAFSYQGGLRAEYSSVITTLLQTNETNARDYLDFFPSIHFGYELKNENTLQISYSRRINRPRFHWLNPFFTYSDSRNRWGGNPNLDPEYTNSVELGHIKYWEKGSLTSSLYYRHTTDVVDRIRTINEGITETTPQNLAEQDDIGFELTFSKDVLPVWKMDGNVNFFRSITDGGIYGSADNYSWSTRINSRTTLFDKVETQIRLNYRGPQDNTQGRSKSVFHMDFGASIDLLQNRSTLTFNISDVFNTRKRRYIAQGEGFYSEGEWRWRARQMVLNFTYRLNQREERQDRQGNRDGMGDDMEMF